jgi:hypothetical protein
MIIIKILKTAIFTAFVINAKCQSLDSLNNSSKVVYQLSYFWKNDSLGTNGARLYSYKKLLSSKLDTMSEQYLYDKFGKPNRIKTSGQKVEYIYNYYDIKAMPREFRGPYACLYIGFLFDRQQKRLLKILEGDIDY